MMSATPGTRLIDAMLADEGFFDRVIEYHPATIKFQRVLNDEQVAQELQLADVARMIDLPVPTLVEIAQGRVPREEAPAVADDPLPTGWIECGQDARILDLRPVFEAGIEPLMLILEEVSKLNAGRVLVLEAPFHPLPLRRLLRGRGIESLAREASGGSWQVALRHMAAQAD